MAISNDNNNIQQCLTKEPTSWLNQTEYKEDSSDKLLADLRKEDSSLEVSNKLYQVKNFWKNITQISLKNHSSLSSLSTCSQVQLYAWPGKVKLLLPLEEKCLERLTHSTPLQEPSEEISVSMSEEIFAMDQTQLNQPRRKLPFGLLQNKLTHGNHTLTNGSMNDSFVRCISLLLFE